MINIIKRREKDYKTKRALKVQKRRERLTT